jgi:hypothetical protein
MFVFLVNDPRDMQRALAQSQVTHDIEEDARKPKATPELLMAIHKLVNRYDGDQNGNLFQFFKKYLCLNFRHLLHMSKKNS